MKAHLAPRFVLLLLIFVLLLAPGCEQGGEGSVTEPESPAAAAPRGLPPGANVIVILVDTLRFDAMGFGGYDKPTSPRLDAWARRGVVFENATTPGAWTKPAVMSLFSGLYPATHAVQDKDHVASDDLVTLAEVLRARGYATHGLVTNFAASDEFNLGQGFDSYPFLDKEESSEPLRRRNYLPIGDVDRHFREFLARPEIAMGSQPFFLYVHTTDPHFPYEAPAAYRKFGGDPRGRYDAEVLYTDDFVGRWLDTLESSGLLDRSIVVFTADHGEEFREHGGTGHGITVFEECVRVPLVVWAPGLQPGRRTSQVSLADLAPTLLEAIRQAPTPGFASQGRSFWPVATEGDTPGGWSWSYSELVFPTKGIAFGYREQDHKVVRIVRDKLGRQNQLMLFHVASDPFEQRDLAASDPDRLRTLSARMKAVRDQHEAAAFEGNAVELEGEALERMRGLGYVD